ncbi:MAG: hypothetical protein ACREJN_08295, partial [Nitrospiraceae bacterium]
GGIALGHTTEQNVNRIMMEVNRLTANLFDRMSFCVHHPNAIGDTLEETLEKSQCFCRKPLPGQLYSSMFSLNSQYGEEYYRPASCLMVGDMQSDEMCAKSIDIPFMWAESWRKMNPEDYHSR